MKAEDVLGLLIPVTYFLFLAIEGIRPARQFPKIAWWRLIGLGFYLSLIMISVVLPTVLHEEWIREHRLIDGSRLGTFGGVVVAFLCTTFIDYWIHRAKHRFTWVWRWIHQLHHSPERVDIPGSTFFHPAEVMVMTTLGIFVTVFLLGASPLVAAWIGYIGAFNGMFQHFNIRTPRWIGYVTQRPEMHCLHHEPGQARYNFSDFPLWDLLFGTFKNPATFEGRVGFEPAAARRIGAMLLGKQVSF